MMNKSINMQRFYFIVRDSGKFNKMLHYLRYVYFTCLYIYGEITRNNLLSN